MAEADDVRWWSGRGRLPLLVGLTAGPAAVEAAILGWTGNRSPLALAPQAAAPNPFGVFHDLRWIVVYHDSWLSFAALSVGAVVARALYTVAIIVVAWPPGRRRPGTRRLIRTSLAVTAVTALALAPWAAVTVAAAVTALSWFSIGSVLALLVLAVVLQRGPMAGTWWRGLPPPAVLLWVVATFAVLTAGALVVGLGPDWAAVPVAAAGGAANAPLWRGLLGTVVGRRARLPRLPAVPAVALVLLLALAGSGAVAGAGSRAAARPPPALVLRDGTEHPRQAVLYVGGYDSRYDGSTASVPDPAGRTSIPVHRFSYAGLDAQGHPRPYAAADTHQSLARSADLLAAQVREIRRRTGRPVALLGHSEGTLVIRTYLERDPRPEVEAVALLSPLTRPARVYYPPAHADTGWGIAAGWQLRIIFAVVNRTGGARLGADTPFVRSLLDHGPRYRDRMLQPVPGVRMIAVLPLLDAVTDTPGPRPRIPVVVVPERHAMDYGRARTQRLLVAFLNGMPVTPANGPAGAAYRVLGAAGAAWQAPELATGLNPVWQTDRGSS
jgi:hypothetical protein